MLGQLNPENRHVMIIGAGFAGLYAGYQLKKAGFKVEIHEASERAGGLIQTTHTEFGLVEHAAHSLRMSDALMATCTELNVPLYHAQTKKKYIYCDGKCQKFPLKLIETLKIARNVLTKHYNTAPVTLAELAERYLSTAALDHLFHPLASGIYAQQPHELALDYTFPGLKVAPGKTFISHIMGKKPNKVPTMAPARGMQQLIDALIHELTDDIHLKSKIDEVPTDQNAIIATEAKQAATILTKKYPKLSHLVSEISYIPLISAGIFVRRDEINIPEGIGVLNSATAGRRCLGVLFNSFTFPQRVANDEYINLTMMIGGSQAPELTRLPDSKLYKLIQTELEQMFNFSGKPLGIFLTRWPAALPKYSLQHAKVLKTVEHEVPTGLILAGNYTGDISLRGMSEKLAKLATL